jgi:hypothetical protein
VYAPTAINATRAPAARLTSVRFRIVMTGLLEGGSLDVTLGGSASPRRACEDAPKTFVGELSSGRGVVGALAKDGARGHGGA